MEHLTCFTPAELWQFVQVTGMPILIWTETEIVLSGEKVFSYLWDTLESKYCIVPWGKV